MYMTKMTTTMTYMNMTIDDYRTCSLFLLMPAAIPSCGASFFWCSYYDRNRCHHVGGKARDGN